MLLMMMMMVLKATDGASESFQRPSKVCDDEALRISSVLCLVALVFFIYFLSSSMFAIFNFPLIRSSIIVRLLLEWFDLFCFNHYVISIVFIAHFQRPMSLI